MGIPIPFAPKSPKPRILEGVVAGFRSPKYTTGINVPGYHEHFITDDRQGGGRSEERRVGKEC